MAMEMQYLSGVLKIRSQDDSGARPGRILDLCMAPGGLLAVAMRMNPGSEAVAFSLPPSKGGTEILLESVKGFTVEGTGCLNITILAADMGVTTISTQHPDAGNFFTKRQLAVTEIFDLVLYDGQVQLNHEQASYREGQKREPIRLLMSELVLGLEHFAARRNHDRFITQSRCLGDCADSTRIQQVFKHTPLQDVMVSSDSSLVLFNCDQCSQSKQRSHCGNREMETGMEECNVFA